MNQSASLADLLQSAARDIAGALEQRIQEVVEERLRSLPRVQPPKELLTSRETAELIGFSPNTLANWRSLNEPDAPPHVKIGGAVRYRRDDVDEWIRRHRPE